MTGKVDRYDYAFSAEGDAWAARLLRKVPPGSRVLELGPGPGAMTKVLLERGHDVTVVENDPAALALLRQLPCTVVEGNLEAPDWSAALAGQRFGAVLACDVLEHLSDPGAVLGALLEVVAPDGKLVISVPNVAYGGLLASLRLGHFDYAEKGLLDRTHLRFFTRRSLDTMLLERGWVGRRWEANRVPVARSEFEWAWRALDGVERQQLETGWADFDVYQWLAVATPMDSAAAAEIVHLRADLTDLRGELHELSVRHADEHASLLEHQKAFAEAKTAIDALAGQLDALRREREAMAEVLQGKEAQVEGAQARIAQLDRELAELRDRSWPRRLRRALARSIAP